MISFPGYPAGSVRPLMSAEGNGLSKILAMGEALGEHEEKDQLPFRPYAEAGSVLERALYRAGVPRESLTLTNLVWYRPPKNWLDGSPWERDAIDSCQKFNDDLIESRQPKVILALGSVPFRELTGMSGAKQGIEMCRGFIVPAAQYKIPVIGTYHPSYLRRGSKERSEEGSQGKVKSAGGGTQGMNLLGVMIRDIQLAKEIAENGVKEFKYDNYKLGGTISDWTNALEFLHRNPSALISYDFETQDSLQRESEEDAEHIVREVTQVQISWRIGQALVSSWTPELLPILRDIIQLPNPKIDWNGRKFDRPILRDMGIRTDLGEFHDGMDFWHHAQPDLPRGLQYATSFFCPEVRPWKHYSIAQPLYYGALDVDMPQRIFQGLKTSLSLIRNPHSSVSLWGDGKYGGYSGQVVRLAPVLDKMTERGIPVDEEKRLALDIQFSATLKDQLEKLQSLVPDHLKNVSPKEGYVRHPDELVEKCSNCAGKGKIKIAGIRKLAQCSLCAGEGKRLLDPSTPEWVKRTFTCEVSCGCIWSKKKKATPLDDLANCDLCGNTGKRVDSVTRLARLQPFLPNGGDQVMRYIKFKREEDIQARISKGRTLDQAERLTEWKIPTDHKTGKETTAEAGIRRLAQKTNDNVLPLVLNYREISKLQGTYVKGWKPGPDGRVHPSFGFKPATGQLSSENPNAQNMVQHSELARVMNQMIRARLGYKMVKLDWKSFHAITAGFEAQDLDFVRIARVDIHSFLTLVGILKIERPEIAFNWKNDELKDRLKFFRKQDKTYSNFSRPRHPGGMTFGEIRDELAKRIVYGWEFGQGPRSLYILNQESFTGEHEADLFQQELKRLFNKVDKWQSVVRMEADNLGYLTSRYGFVRRFYDVYQRRPVADNYQPRGNDKIYQNAKGQKWLLKPGDDHEAVVAFRPANDAFGIKRHCLVRFKEEEIDEKYNLISETHDDARFECPDSLVDEMIPTVQAIMESKSSYLIDPIVAPDGLWCGVDVAVGQDWDSLEKI